MLSLVRKFLHRKPFHPFRIVTKSGERHDVTDPVRVALRQPDLFLFGRNERMKQLKESDIDVVYEPRSGNK